MKKTALIILNYNNSHDTRSCIESIQRHNSTPVKYVVVDNASAPQEREALRAVLDDVFANDYDVIDTSATHNHASLRQSTLVLNDRNLGYACGNNSALEIVERDDEIDNVMILNNDILFVEDIIPALIHKLDTLPECALVSPVLYKRDMQGYDMNCARRDVSLRRLITDNFLHYYYKLRGLRPYHRDRLRFMLNDTAVASGVVEIELPSGSCMLIKKSVFKEIGYFDPNTFLYYEENILHKKFAKAGKRVYLSLDEKCIHLGASTTNALPDNKWLMRVAKESEAYYVRAYSGAPLLLRWLHSASISFFMASFSLLQALKRKK